MITWIIPQNHRYSLLQLQQYSLEPKVVAEVILMMISCNEQQFEQYLFPRWYPGSMPGRYI